MHLRIMVCIIYYIACSLCTSVAAARGWGLQDDSSHTCQISWRGGGRYHGGGHRTVRHHFRSAMRALRAEPGGETCYALYTIVNNLTLSIIKNKILLNRICVLNPYSSMRLVLLITYLYFCFFLNVIFLASHFLPK